MKILFVASEVAPYAKTGGLADVAGALPRALRRLGHDVRVFLPHYARIRAATTEVFPEHVVRLGRHTYQFALRRAADEDTFFVHCPVLYGREAIYTADPDEHLRFLVLARAALESALRMGFQPDVIHTNDWQGGLIPLMLRTQFAGQSGLARARTLLTIHNLQYQGIFPAGILDDTGLAAWEPFFHQEHLRAGRLGFLVHGLLYADGLSTVSPSYAREIQGPAQGAGLDELLRARASRLVGILNGVDEHDWDPATDRHLPHRFDRHALAGKQRNKEALLARLRLRPGADVPLFGIVSRFAAQKGLDLAAEVLARVLAQADVRVAVLGSGEHRLEQMFQALERRFPDKVRFTSGYDEPLAHLIEAGADFFLMPSRYEPCGLNQMYSLKYGTVPIVHKTGGLADTVELWNPHTGEGTGFPFEHHDAAGLSWAIGAALGAYRDRASFARLVQNGMAKDFSWTHQAQLYVELYARLTRL